MLETAAIRPGESVLVLGATGTLGQLALQFATILGAGRVVGASRNAAALARLRERGIADATVTMGSDDDVTALKSEAGEGYDGDETAGHIDEIATFVRPGVLLMGMATDPSDPNYAICHDNLARLTGVTDAAGRPLEVVTVPIPARRDADGQRLTLSYTNLYIANGGVVMPCFEDSADDEAFRVVRKLFPDREVVQVVANDIVRGDGGIHCITQQQPA